MPAATRLAMVDDLFSFLNDIGCKTHVLTHAHDLIASPIGASIRLQDKRFTSQSLQRNTLSRREVMTLRQ